MSVADELLSPHHWHRLRHAWRRLRQWLLACGRFAFGDRRGLFVFFAAVLAAMLVWRTTVSINDNLTVINGLVAVSQGRVFVTDPTFGETLASPGMVRHDGRAIPRNFAHIVLALPALWVLQGIQAVADLRLAGTGVWWLTLLAAMSVGGSLLDRERMGRIVGSGVALTGFAASVPGAAPLEPPHLAALALQATTVVVAGLSAVLVYRTVGLLHDRRVALAAGLSVALASPAVLWASIPKRHVLTAGFALASLYLLVSSRIRDPSAAPDAGDQTSGNGTGDHGARGGYRWRRALAYAPIGLTAWLHAAEGFVLLIAIFAVDLLGGRDRAGRTLGAIAVVFGCSLVPLVVTNVLISGDPFTVPRMLAPYDAASDGVRFVGETGGGGGGRALLGAVGAVLPPAATAAISAVTTAIAPLVSMLRRGLVFIGMLETGATAALTEPFKLYHTFLRSGYVGTDGPGATGLAINLAFLEALPLAGVLVAAPVVAGRRLYAARPVSRRGLRRHLATPAGTADAFVGVYALLLTLLYLPRFPLHAMLTVRYIYPLFPLAIYAAARLPTVRAAITATGWTSGFAYSGGVLIGGQLSLLVIAGAGLGVDEAMQGYALLALGLAGVLGAWSVIATWTDRYARAGAVLLGLAGATTTNLVGIIVYQYFGRAFLLPIIPI